MAFLGNMRIFFRVVKITFIGFFVSSILAVIALRWLPVPITPLMVIRCVQHVGSGEPIAIHHKWVPLKKYLPTCL